ncbi:MAG: hypothetical protein Q4G53_00570 [Clostridia bacterium]|nr:hypothetical protein [Clostridia bacterium]
MIILFVLSASIADGIVTVTLTDFISPNLSSLSAMLHCAVAFF